MKSISDLTENDIRAITDIEELKGLCLYLLRELRKCQGEGAGEEDRVEKKQDMGYGSPGPQTDDTIRGDLIVLKGRLDEQDQDLLRKVEQALSDLETGDRQSITRAKRVVLDVKVELAKRNKLRQMQGIIGKWSERGYDTSYLADLLEKGDLYALETEISNYKTSITKIDRIKDALKHAKIDEDAYPYVQKLMEVLNDPRKIVEIEDRFAKIMSNLKPRSGKESDIPKRYSNMDFDSFIKRGNEGVIKLIMDTISGNMDMSPMYLRGPRGCGKTHLLVAAVRQSRSEGRNAYYIDVTKEPEKLKKKRSYQGILVCLDHIPARMLPSTARAIESVIDQVNAQGGAVMLASEKDLTKVSSPDTERLISRVLSGVVIDINPMPKKEFKEIAYRILEHYSAKIDKDTLNKIAERSYPNPMNLKKNINEALAKIALKDNPSEGDKH